MSDFRIDASGFRDPAGRFAALSPALQAAQAAVAAELGDTIVRAAQQVSPVGQYPFGRPDGPRFSESWQAHWEATDRGGALVIENTDPKADLIIRSTPPHLIAVRPERAAAAAAEQPPRRAMLRFGTPDSPIFRRSVHHPGTAGNDVPGKLAQAVQADAEAALQRVAVTAAAALHDALSQ